MTLINFFLCLYYKKDSKVTPSLSPTLSFNNPSYFQFCGKTFGHAVNNCSLKTYCSSNDDCPSRASCFAQLPGHCNAIEPTNSLIHKHIKIHQYILTSPRTVGALLTGAGIVGAGDGTFKNIGLPVGCGNVGEGVEFCVGLFLGFRK